MKLFKIFLGFWLLVGLVFGVSLFFPREFKVERSIVINKPIYETFAYLNNIQNIAKLSPWDKKIDSSMTWFFSKNLSNVNSTYYFSGNLLGKGYLKITECVPNEMLKTNLDINNHELTSSSTFYFEPIGYDKTKLTWKDYKDVGYNPLHRFQIPSKTELTELQFDEGLVKIRIAIMSNN
jgi:hypothetical protein